MHMHILCFCVTLQAHEEVSNLLLVLENRKRSSCSWCLIALDLFLQKSHIYQKVHDYSGCKTLQESMIFMFVTWISVMNLFIFSKVVHWCSLTALYRASCHGHLYCRWYPDSPDPTSSILKNPNQYESWQIFSHFNSELKTESPCVEEASLAWSCQSWFSYWQDDNMKCS